MSLQQVTGTNSGVEALLSSLSGTASSLANQTYNWAQQQFAQNSALTSQVVNNYMQNASSATGLANNNISRYENLFQPEENQLVQDANTYASTARIKQAMGQAESDTGQAMDAGRINAEQNLQSYGIDPSSGRYQALESAQQAQKAAAQAGAGNVAQLNTENTARQLRAQAIQVGQQYPGQAINALNASSQAAAGAENAQLANTNTGTSAMAAADPFLNTAVNAGKFQPYPPMAGTTLSTSSGQKSGGGGSSMPMFSSGGGSNNYSSGGGGGSNGYDYSGNMGGNSSYSGGGYNTSQPNSGIMTGLGDGSSSNTNMYSNISNGGTSDYIDPSTYGGYNTGGIDLSGAGGYSDSSSYSGGSGWGDTSASGDTSSGYSGFAAGGEVTGMPDETTGGHVPMDASPSGGQNVDDVPANLNAGEFVVPRDVAKWKGEEFFQKLIAQSRKARITAPAAGKPGQAPQGAPRFSSQAMPA